MGDEFLKYITENSKILIFDFEIIYRASSDSVISHKIRHLKLECSKAQGADSDILKKNTGVTQHIMG